MSYQILKMCPLRHLYTRLFRYRAQLGFRKPFTIHFLPSPAQLCYIMWEGQTTLFCSQSITGLS